jgi:hypothetical protein
MASGHQRGEGGGHSKAWFEHRSKKLNAQRESIIKEKREETPQVMKNVRAYLPGYMVGATDHAMKELLASAGGEVL